MTNVKVKLSRTYEVPGIEPFDTIEIREPTYSEIFQSGIGRPFEFHAAKSGTMLVRSPEIVDRYAQLLVVAPGYENILGISAIDGGRVEAVINGFFMEPAALNELPASSSSDTVFDQTTSRE